MPSGSRRLSWERSQIILLLGRQKERRSRTHQRPLLPWKCSEETHLLFLFFNPFVRNLSLTHLPHWLQLQHKLFLIFLLEKTVLRPDLLFGGSALHFLPELAWCWALGQAFCSIRISTVDSFETPGATAQEILNSPRSPKTLDRCSD